MAAKKKKKPASKGKKKGEISMDDLKKVSGGLRAPRKKGQ